MTIYSLISVTAISNGVHRTNVATSRSGADEGNGAIAGRSSSDLRSNVLGDTIVDECNDAVERTGVDHDNNGRKSTSMKRKSIGEFAAVKAIVKSLS